MQPFHGLRITSLALAGFLMAFTSWLFDVSAQTGSGSVLDSLMVDVIVTLDDSYAPGAHAANETAAEAIAQSFGVTATNTYGTVLFGFSASVPVGRLTAFENDPRVVDVELVQPVTATAPGGGGKPGGGGGGGKPDGGGGDGDPAQTTSWGYVRIHAADIIETGAGIHVYVFDSGIDTDHPDLIANIATEDHYAVPAVAAICRGKKSCPPWEDNYHHGTQVAGIIGAADNTIGVIGVAPAVTLHAYKVLDSSGNGDDAGVIDAIDHLAARIDGEQVSAPVVANMSFTTSGQTKSGTCDASDYQSNGGSGTYDSYHRAVCELARRGVVVITGAGNGGADAENYVPAAYDDAAITVSATYQDDRWSYQSNWGNNTGGGWTSRASAPVAIAAPGEAILTTNNDGGYVENSGTSFAAPHVAGAVALWLQGPGSTCQGYGCFTGARSALLSVADDVSTNTSDPLFGQSNPHEEDVLDLTCLTGC